MTQPSLDLSQVFTLEPHGPDTFLGESPPYEWGRIYGGLVVAQALWAATFSVRETHEVHSLHAYFILGGDPSEPVRYEVDRLRNGRSFTTRQVIARQSSGAILVLSCSFQRSEEGPETQSARFPEGIPTPEELPIEGFAGLPCCDVPVPAAPPRSLVWTRFPIELSEDQHLHACALAYVADLNPMFAIGASHPRGPTSALDWRTIYMSASLDHAMWFHRPIHADEWMLIDMTGHGVIGTRGLATGPVFRANGTHVATIAQEGLLRERNPPKS